MAEFLVLEDAQTNATPLPAGQIVDDGVFDVAQLERAGIPLLAYNPATMEAPLTAFLGLAEPRTPGMLLALLVAAGAIGGGGGGGGDVNGPASSTDNAVARFNGLTGKLLQNSLVTITDLGSIALPAGQTVDGRDVSADGILLDATAAALTAHIGAGGAAHAAATPSDAGFMSAADKTAHDAVVAEAIRDGDFPGSYTADLTRTGAGTYAGLKSNLAAIVAPTVTDDSSADYAVGSRWVDVAADRSWLCVDATVGAAVWLELGRATIEYVSGFVADATPANRRGYTLGSDPLSATLSWTACVVAQPVSSVFVSGTPAQVFGTFDGGSPGAGWAIRWSTGAGWGAVFIDATFSPRTLGYIDPMAVRKFAVVHLRVSNAGLGGNLRVTLFVNGSQVAEFFGATEGGPYIAGGPLTVGPPNGGAAAPAFGGRVHGAGYVASALSLDAIAAHAESCIEVGRLVDPSTPFDNAWRVEAALANPGISWASFKAGAPLAALGAPTALPRALKPAPVLWA